MSAVKFWLGWMKITVVAVIILGIMTIFFADSQLMIIFNAPFKRIFIDKIGYSTELVHMIRFLENSMGIMLIAWSVIMYFLIQFPLKKGEIWAWNALFLSVLTWYLPSVGISLYYKINSMILFDTIVFLQAMAPLLILRNSILKGKIKEDED